MLLRNIKKFNFSIFIFILNLCFAQFKATVTPLIDKDYASTLINFIKNSKNSIYVIMFQTDYYPEYPESISNQILKELINANKKRVNVEIILEEDPKNETVSEKNLKTARFLVENGVKVYLDSKSRTTHIKLVLIDDKYVFIGSHNWNYYALEKNREISILIESEELVKVFIDYFKKLKKSCRLFRISQ
ncbi:MAG: phospholipase D-like domain-containing protein [Candidatus Omnitrophica bacterium]|nr:phospholipase D-like domain-containing protein [Candidatus Omnitrophota bacterium]